MHQRRWVLGSAIVALLSFYILYYIVSRLWPHPSSILAGPQLLLLTFLFLGVSASTVPVTVFFNNRFSRPGWPERDKTRLLRQGAWVGMFGVLVTYLQFIRAFNWTFAAVLAGVFALIETFFLTRE